MSVPPPVPDPDAPPPPSDGAPGLDRPADTLTGTQADEPAGPAVDRYAQDSAPARALRRLDRGLGLVEQAALFALLLAIVGVAVATTAIHLAWADEFIRYGVFAMAMVGGAYATHHQRLLSMDVVSRVLPPRGRAALRVVLALFTLGMTLVLLSGGRQILTLQQQAHQAGVLPTWLPAAFIPLGMALIAVHLVMQAIIELDYLRRGLCAPEPEQSAI